MLQSEIPAVLGIPAYKKIFVVWCKMRHIFLSIYFFIVLFPAFTCYCEAQDDIIEVKQNGAINWSLRSVEAKGFGILATDGNVPKSIEEAFEEAKEDAIANLFEIVCEIKIDPSLTIKDMIAENDKIVKEIKEMVRNAELTGQKYLSDGTVEITLSMSMAGGFSQYVLPRIIKQIEPVKLMYPENKNGNDVDRHIESDIYTGLIVVAEDIKVMPALFFTLLDEDRNEVYGANFASREFAVQNGMCGYTSNIEAAKNDPRAGANPMIVKGLTGYGGMNSDIIISNPDASKIKKAPEHLAFLKECNVIIVITDR